MSQLAVLISVYKPNVDLLIETFNSLKSQNFKDFTVYVCIDGKDAELEKIIRRFDQKLDLKFFVNEKNIGLTKSLNLLLERSSEPLVARLDAEDICYKERFIKQIQEFSENEELVLCGSHYCLISNNEKNIIQMPCTDAEIRREIRTRNPFLHSAVMFRRMTDIKYDESFKYTQDYDLWIRLAKLGLVQNVDDILLIRNETNGISSIYAVEQLIYKVKIKYKHFAYLLSTALIISLCKNIIKILLLLIKRIIVR